MALTLLQAEQFHTEELPHGARSYICATGQHRYHRSRDRASGCATVKRLESMLQTFLLLPMTKVPMDDAPVRMMSLDPASQLLVMLVGTGAVPPALMPAAENVLLEPSGEAFICRICRRTVGRGQSELHDQHVCVLGVAQGQGRR